MKSVLIVLLSFFTFAAPLWSQSDSAVFTAPFDFELLLSGNFGELRSNHFHSGVDFKTQGVVGKPIKCVANGYISRASVQPGGYGRALYVIHDNGYMTVYGHLESFPKPIAERVYAPSILQRSVTELLLFSRIPIPPLTVCST